MDYSTILQLNNKTFCAFCGNQILPNEHGAFHCQCNDAKLFRQALATKLHLEMEALNSIKNAPKPKFQLASIITPISDITPSDTQPDDEPNMCW